MASTSCVRTRTNDCNKVLLLISDIDIHNLHKPVNCAVYLVVLSFELVEESLTIQRWF